MDAELLVAIKKHEFWKGVLYTMVATTIFLVVALFI